MEYIRITCRENPQLSLSVGEVDPVVLANDNPSDERQIWLKETRFVKDPVNTFALINYATGQAIKAAGKRNPLQLADHFDPNKIDDLLLWNKGNRALRMATDNDLNFDAFTGGGVKDGTAVGLWSWNAGKNQQWDFSPRPPKMTLVRLVTKFDIDYCLSILDRDLPILTGINVNDQYQKWYMIQKGTEGAIFVNASTNQALMHSIKTTPLVRCKVYTPYNTEGVKWNIKAVEDGLSAINVAGENTNKFNWTAVDVDGGVEGTVIVLSNWADNNKQKWKIVPIYYIQNITIPSALVSKKLGDNLKRALENGDMVNVNLDWRESMPHPDERVEYEFWTNSNDECGPKCDSQMNFVKNFRGAAQILEKNGYTQFTPHYITWYCPEAFIDSKQCQSQCINQGRYCAPDPEQDFGTGYDGKDVVLQNLRQICVFNTAKESGKPWLWWDYVTDFSVRCPMEEDRYTKECAEEVILSLGIDLKPIDRCIGDPEADEENMVLKAEQDAQIGEDPRGDVTILPTLIINNRQYRGKLDKNAVLKAICAGFQETTEPAVCLSEDMETNECLENNGGCWQDKATNVTACKDTFRGRVCECPIVQGVKFVGDGYTHCEASGSGRCEINNGGCWNSTRNGKTYSACSNEQSKGCKCPLGFKGDGINTCEDVDECKEKLACQCKECSCKNTWGSYECSCDNDLLYMREHDMCISQKPTSQVGWGFLWVIFFGLALAGFGGYAIYKYRIRSYMDSEIRAIMAQYMPLDNPESHNLAARANV